MSEYDCTLKRAVIATSSRKGRKAYIVGIVLGSSGIQIVSTYYSEVASAVLSASLND